MNNRIKEIGKLLWEKQLFEMNGNIVAADRIEKIIKEIRKRKSLDDERRKDAVTVQGM